MGSEMCIRDSMTAGEVLFLETMLLAVSSAGCIISYASNMPPRNTNNEAFVFEPAFLLLNTKKHKPSSESHSIYVPQAQQNSLQSALRSSKFHTEYFRVDQSAKTQQASKHERASQVLLRRAMCLLIVRVFKFSFFDKKPSTINFDFFYVPLTLISPVTGHRLDFTILVWMSV